MDLNKDKIIFKSEAEIYEHVKSKVLDALKHVEEHDGCCIETDDNCCSGIWEESVKSCVDKYGVDHTISKYFSAILRQRELDPNIDTGPASSAEPLPDINAPQFKFCKVNFIYNDIDASTLDVDKYIQALNDFFSNKEPGTGPYANRKQLDTEIRFEKVETVLTGDQVVEWDASNNGTIISSGEPASCWPGNSAACAEYYGFKENHFNVYFARHPMASAYAYYPAPFPLGGFTLFPIYNAKEGAASNRWQINTIAHEIGHNLDLDHTFGGAAPGSCDTDDGISDTPLTIANYTATRANHCGDGLSMNENIMDYATSSIDLEDMILTKGQTAAAHAALEMLLGPSWYTELPFDPTSTTTSTTVTQNPSKLAWPCPDGHDLLSFVDPSWTGLSGDTYGGHTGTDIGYHLPTGYPNIDWDDMVNNPKEVYAVAAGTVVWVDDSHTDQCDINQTSGPHATGGALCDGTSNVVVIDHGSDTGLGYRYTGYYHLQKDNVPVSFGQAVAKGDVIGYVGSSGSSTNPHLHLEVGTSHSSGSVSDIVDPFKSKEEWGGSNTSESLWEDQCSLPIYNDKTTSGSVPPLIDSCTTTTTTTTTTTINPNNPWPPLPTDCNTITLTNASVLGINSEGKFTGEGVVRYKTVERIDLEGFIDVRATNTDIDGIKEVQAIIENDLKNNVAACGNIIRPISVNGNYLGRGKIISFTYDANEGALNNQILVGSWAATLEFHKDIGDWSKAIDSEASYWSGGISIIDDISESFDVSLSENDTYSFNHSVNVKLFNDPPRTDPWPQEAKDLCSAIFRERYENTITSFNLILGSHYGDYNAAARELHTEDYDLHQGTFNFARSFTLNKESGSGYSVVRTHSFTKDANGIFKVVENGEILGNSAHVENSATWLNTEIGGSYSRCLTVFDAYYGHFGGAEDIVEEYNNRTGGNLTITENTLHSKPLSVTKKLAFGESSVSYSVEYTNDLGIWDGGGDYYLERTLSLTKVQGGHWEVTEQGILNYNEVKNSGFDPVSKINSIRGDSSLISSRCYTYLQSHHDQDYYHHQLGNQGSAHNAWNLKKSNFSTTKHGKKITYSYIFTDADQHNPSGRYGLTTARSAELKSSNTSPTQKFGSFIMPHGGDEILSTANGSNKAYAQTNLTQTTYTIDIQLYRQNQNIFETVYDISTTIEEARQLLLSQVLSWGRFVRSNSWSLDPKEVWISNASYTFNSERKLSVSVTAQYPMLQDTLRTTGGKGYLT